MTAVLVTARLETVVALLSATGVGAVFGWWLRSAALRLRGAER